MPQPKLSMFRPQVSDSAIERVGAVLRSRWIGQGALVEEFEDALRRRLELPHAVAVNCSSSALRLALSILGVKPGDEVITTPMTCTLTNHPILEQFATPVFADIQYETGNIDPKDVERRITSRTRAIVCTHWGGMPCDLYELNEIARKYGLTVLEDASEGIGAVYRGRPIGSISRFTAFSFQAIQILTTGEGGLLATLEESDAHAARVHRWYGIDREHRLPNDRGYYDFDITGVGFGYHLTNVAAAIGLGNLEQLDRGLEVRRRVAAYYREHLAGVAGVRLLDSPSDRVSSCHFFTLHVDARDQFSRRLREHGIETSIVHARNDAYSVFGGKRRDLPQVDRFDASYIGLPCHQGMGLQEAASVTDVIRQGW